MKTQQNTDSRGHEILARMGQIPVIVQGKVSDRRSGGKVTGCKLQRWRGGRNETRHIPAGLVDTVREGTAGYSRLMDLVQQFVEIREADAFGAEDCGKKKPMRR